MFRSIIIQTQAASTNGPILMVQVLSILPSQLFVGAAADTTVFGSLLTNASQCMKLVFALLVIVWWISVWGLADLLMEGWSREQKFWTYVGGIVLVGATVALFPHLLDRL